MPTFTWWIWLGKKRWEQLPCPVSNCWPPFKLDSSQAWYCSTATENRSIQFVFFKSRSCMQISVLCWTALFAQVGDRAGCKKWMHAQRRLLIRRREYCLCHGTITEKGSRSHQSEPWTRPFKHTSPSLPGHRPEGQQVWCFSWPAWQSIAWITYYWPFKTKKLLLLEFRFSIFYTKKSLSKWLDCIATSGARLKTPRFMRRCWKFYWIYAIRWAHAS